MYVLHKKSWFGLENRRFWAIVAYVCVLALVTAAVAGLVLAAMWFFSVDISRFDLYPLIN